MTELLKGRKTQTIQWYIEQKRVGRCSVPDLYSMLHLASMYGIMTEELVIREIRIDEAAGPGDSHTRMTSFEVIMPLKLQSAKINI